MPPRILKGAAKASHKRSAAHRLVPPNRSPISSRMQLHHHLQYSPEGKKAKDRTQTHWEMNHKYPQAPWTVNAVRSWANQEQLLIDLTLEELCHDHMVVEGVKKYSLKPNINWKVCRGRSRDAPWCRLQREDDWEAFIDAVHVERNTPKVKWSAFNPIDTQCDPIRAASQPEFNQQTPVHASQTQPKARMNLRMILNATKGSLLFRPCRLSTNAPSTTSSTAMFISFLVNINTLPMISSIYGLILRHPTSVLRHLGLGPLHWIDSTRLVSALEYQFQSARTSVVILSGVTTPVPDRLLEPFKLTDQLETPESRHSSSGVPQLPTPVTAPQFDLPLPPSNQPTPTPTPTTTTIDPQMLRGLSHLQGPAADDLDGLLAYFKTKVPDYIDFDCQTV
ncbi:hypothetical protein G7K_5641-t1 [Saitoella complicata NRRL Y-17804]|uniref:Uncharacterized protein n=1 Tax=Saitoella complicata (strain BCRC 22490 / CBS 7301 / JCM 7358 / NBRC 10748 / NRRL Y-17804) TaxID=698492 RepID=A0A0E9NNU0_SAICN|nr:hypothetical protein G7K_5641-t1 [Saitoella complicata NRRL Y-17804]